MLFGTSTNWGCSRAAVVRWVISLKEGRVSLPGLPDLTMMWLNARNLRTTKTGSGWVVEHRN